ncbi:RAQPRD family integrative conjugative element protein [Pseudomonas aeruginosa]
METTRNPTQLRRSVVAMRLAALLLAAAGLQPAIAADAPDNTAEREMLAAVTRQLELLDRLAERAATTAPQERARYHFDYPRLRDDLERMRTGVRDYLVPQRAQPRDPAPLAGDYTRSNATTATPSKEATSP